MATKRKATLFTALAIVLMLSQNKMKKTYFATGLVAFATMIVGCSFSPPKKMYEGPERPISELALVRTHDSFESSGNRLSYDWISIVKTVDGKPLGKEGQIRLLPGKYRIGMICHMNPKYQGRYKVKLVEMDVDLQADKYYHPWCSLNATVIHGSGLPGAIPGTIVGAVAAGYAMPYLSTKPVP